MKASCNALFIAALPAAACQGLIDRSTARGRKKQINDWLSSLTTETKRRSTFAQMWAYLAYMRSRVAIFMRIPLMEGEQRALDLIVSLLLIPSE